MRPKKLPRTMNSILYVPMDNGHPERAFFSKIQNFWAWAEILGGILAISSQIIGTILAL